MRDRLTLLLVPTTILEKCCKSIGNKQGKRTAIHLFKFIWWTTGAIRRTKFEIEASSTVQITAAWGRWRVT